MKINYIYFIGMLVELYVKLSDRAVVRAWAVSQIVQTSPQAVNSPGGLREAKQPPMCNMEGNNTNMI